VIRFPRSIVLAAALFAGCKEGNPQDENLQDSVDSSDSTADLPFVGDDVNTSTERELASSYSLPEAFYTALDTLGVAPEDLSFPDAGATFSVIPTRLRWTDTLRHQGDLAPTFAFMVGEDVEAAVSKGDADRARGLLAAESTYNDRDTLARVDYDERITALDAADPLLWALQAFYEHAPVEGNPDVPSAAWSEIAADVEAQVATFSPNAQAALAFGVEGLVRAAELRDEALTGSGLVPMSTWAELHHAYWNCQTGYSVYSHEYGTDAYPGLDFVKLIQAGEIALTSVERLRVSLQDEVPVVGASLDLTGPLGRIKVLLDDADSEWDDEGDGYFLAVDGGGDDTWIDRIATNTSIYLPVSVALDLSGNDSYRTSTDWTIDDATITKPDARGQGAGIFGIAILDDAEGNDTHHASALSQGVGVFGVGVLVDHGGDDVYEGYLNSQGYGDFGFGLLADLGDGNDSYETLQTSEGYGGPRGVGWLLDESGDDTYLAIADPIVWDWAGEGSNWSGSQGFGYGVRDGFFKKGAPIFSGGLGGLFDLEGDDDYQCAVMCQGFGYGFGTGLFFDRSGNDDHLVTHKYSMGAATHWAVGLYVDGQGEDTYRNSDDDECIGEGYDASVAFHLDLGSEDDTYTIDNFGQFTLGIALHPALGVLINEGGDDSYNTPDSTYGIGRSYIDTDDRASYLAGVPSVGMFLDLGGTDVYGGGRAETANDAEWVQVDPLGGGWDPKLDHGYGLDTH
jgi:hypothetical protein